MQLQHLTLAWIAVGIACAVAEMALPKFALIFAALAAFVAGLASATGSRWEVQAALFIACLFLGLLLLRPRVVRRLQSARNLPSRTDVLIGKTALVTEEITLSGSGRVEIDGICWTARARAAVPAGAHVTVESADGIVLNVKS